jgi:alkylation response protein AidB-like acyl-CoA dehydrogenase
MVLWSDFFLVSAKTGEKEISMFMVDKGLPGFTVGKDQKMMGIRGTPHLELFFDNVPLEPLALLGEKARASSWRWARSTWCGWRRWARAPWARPATCWS